MITATHRIITDQCRKRPIDDVFLETMASIEEGLRGALEGWPAGDGTQIHVRVDIERNADKACTEFIAPYDWGSRGADIEPD